MGATGHTTSGGERSFAPARGETQTRIGPLRLNRQGLPDQTAIDRLYEERDFQRACQIYLWALPIVAYGQWQNQHEAVFGAHDGDLVKYVSVRDKLGLITANATTPYVVGFANTARTGPMLLEVPAGEIAGGFGDFGGPGSPTSGSMRRCSPTSTPAGRCPTSRRSSRRTEL